MRGKLLNVSMPNIKLIEPGVEILPTGNVPNIYYGATTRFKGRVPVGDTGLSPRGSVVAYGATAPTLSPPPRMGTVTVPPDNATLGRVTMWMRSVTNWIPTFISWKNYVGTSGLNPMRPIDPSQSVVMQFQKYLVEWQALAKPNMAAMKVMVSPPPAAPQVNPLPDTATAKLLSRLLDIWFKDVLQWCAWYIKMTAKATADIAAADKVRAEMVAAKEEADIKSAEAKKAVEEAIKKEAEANKAEVIACPPGYAYKNGVCVDSSYIKPKETSTTTTQTTTTTYTPPPDANTPPTTTVTTYPSYTDTGSNKLLIAIPIILGVLVLGGIGTFFVVKKKKSTTIEGE